MPSSAIATGVSESRFVNLLGVRVSLIEAIFTLMWFPVTGGNRTVTESTAFRSACTGSAGSFSHRTFPSTVSWSSVGTECSLSATIFRSM